MKYAFPLCLSLALLLGGCSSTSDETAKVPDKSAEELYLDAKANMETGNLQSAIEYLESIISRYPFGPYATQVQLDLIYCYYKSSDNAQGIAAVDRFLRMNPTHPDLDWVLYMRGLMDVQAHDEFFHRLFGIDRSNRDPSDLETAFQDFKHLLRDYPNSKYAPDARQRMVYIKEQMAKYELSVARYYMKRKAYVAAANRSKHILQYFPDTPQRGEALEILSAAYTELGLPLDAADADAVLKANQSS